MPENAKKVKNKLICPCSICGNQEFCKFLEVMEQYVSMLNGDERYPDFLFPTIIDCKYSDIRDRDRGIKIGESK